MSAHPLTRSLLVCRAAMVAALFAVANFTRAQCLDLNGNGASDVWERAFNAEAADPNLDSDGDTVPNRLESIAGTDPFDSRSVPQISPFTMTTNGVSLSIAGVIGKRYQLQGSETLCGTMATNWFSETSLVCRKQSLVTLRSAADAPAKFFRIMVSDVDTDSDGLNDWEEYQLGLDPFSANSSGQVDSAGKALSDYYFAMNRLKLPSATGAAASAGKPGAGVAIYPMSLPTGTGLTAQYFTNASSSYTNLVNFNPTNLFLTTNNAVIDFRWGPATVPNLSNGFYTVRWSGQVEPQYSETYYFEAPTDDGMKLWVNDQLLIDRWLTGFGSFTRTIPLQAGVRYNIRMEYFNRGGSARAQLYWYSASQPRQIVPAQRLYPESDGVEPGAVTSPLYAVAFVGQPFTYTITAANSPLSFAASNVPPGLDFNSTNGVISGIPNLAGQFDVTISASNIVGTAEAVLQLEVIDTGSSVMREVWLGAAGTSVTNIPLHVPASLTNTLGTLEGITDFGDNYGERIRGYVIAPATGNYYFWIAANSSAELWISNDGEPANKVRRAFVAYPKITLPRQWNLLPTQRSGWLALEAGKRYYIEILHKAATGADHWSVGWLLDPTGTNTVPAGVVPGYVLLQYSNTPPAQVPGTLYSANMVGQSGAVSSGVGSATLRVSADESQAVLRFNYSGLSTPVTAKHIHADTYKGKNAQGQIVFDIDTAVTEPDGSYVWQITPSGPLSAADLVEIIKQGKAYLNVHTVNYPAGEINGHFSLAAGTPSYTPPPPPPVWTDDHSNSNAAVRFLQQATFGPKAADITLVRSGGYSAWLTKQFKLPITGHLTNVYAQAGSDPADLYSGVLTFNTWWQQSVTAPDQLRQRIAFALSEILVVSETGPLYDNPRALSAYYDLLLKNSFGNFRNLLKEVTLSPAMGLYLDMRRNDKGNIVTGTHPNENYAREILQLFSVGLNRTWPDGTLVLNSKGDLVPTYDQDVIIGFSHVFTGWNYYQTNQANKRLPVNWNPGADYVHPMVLVPTHHELGTKRLLDNVVLPAAQGTFADTTSTNFDNYCSRDLELALDSIFYNENVGPFICRQLIQRLVTSHPSRDYLARVVAKFNDNGAGLRGDMKAVITAILLDYEARSTNLVATPTFGKQREPLLRATAIARAFPSPPPLSGSFKQRGNSAIVITTTKPHRLVSGDDVFLKFTGSPAPISQAYNNITVTNPNTIVIQGAGASFGTYSQSGTTLTVSNANHGLAAGYRIYLTFSSGGAPGGVYAVDSVVDGSRFTVTTAAAATRSGNCVFPKWNASGLVQSGSNVTFYTPGPHGLKAGNNVYVVFPNTFATNGVYRVTGVPAPNRFTILVGVSGDRTESGGVLLPLVAAPVVRGGTLKIQYSTWQMNYTDGGFSSALNQTPLNSPTVFNFFFPDYKFQGILASAGLTTPEFQLTSDTSVVLQMNFLSTGVFNGNTNGLHSFSGGNGAIMLDFGPWMTPAYTSDAGIPNLVETLNTRLCAGQLSPAVKTTIINYTRLFPYTTPTHAQMRDRVRAVVHLIVNSPEFTIQR